MRWLTKLQLRLRSLFQRSDLERELDAELRFHLEQQMAENVAAGMSKEEARLAALRTVGGVAQIEEECRDARGLRFLETLVHDVRYALRQLRRAPGFTVVAILTLALGTGANLAMFTVMNALMFKSLPVPHPEQLVLLNQGTETGDNFTYPFFQQLQKQQDVFSGVFGFTLSQADLASGGAQHLVFGMLVSGNYFSLLNVHAVLGRTIAPPDDQHGSANVVVLSYGFWQRQFAGDRNIVGRTLSLDKKPFQIIGVMPREFFGTEIGQQVDYAAPLHSLEVMEPESARVFENRQDYWLDVMARLAPGVTLQQARARLHTLANPLNLAVLPETLKPDERAEFLRTPLDAAPAATGSSNFRNQNGHSLIVLSLMLGVVLLIACANIANLLLARAGAHEHEYAVRAALGARRGRVLRQVLTESLLLAIFGVLLGGTFARWGAEWLVRSFTSERFPGYLDLSPDLRTVAFVVGVATVTAVLFGIVPALRLGGVAPFGAMKGAARATAGRKQGRAAQVLISGQIALCVLLLFGAELLVQSLRDLLHRDLGFQPEGVLLVKTDIDDRPAGPQRDQLVDNFLAQLQALPGVQSASRSLITPISGMSIQGAVKPVGAAADRKPLNAYFNLISPRYFTTLGIPLIAGRDFDERDTANSPRMAIVDEGAAQKLFPNQSPLGRSYLHNAFSADRKERTITIVGLAKSAKYRRLADEPPPAIYVPASQNSVPLWGIGTFEVRFAGPAAAMTSEIERAAQAIDPSVSLNVTLLSSQVRASLRQERLMAELSSIFSVLALLLASIGIYGVLAYAVTRRTNEIGVRMALGARASNVLGMVLREALLLVGIGMAIGLPAALGASRLIKSMLYGVTPGDPLILISTIAIMAAIASLAAYLPARRAARIDPMVALRYE